jgi:dTDP-4-amino-4,6-dideoxygalactose transaminase
MEAGIMQGPGQWAVNYMILLNDFKRQWEECRGDVLAAVECVGSSGWYVLGTEVNQFERELAAFWGLEHAVGVGNGMDALEIALRCMGVSAGQKVLTTPLSAFATTLAIVRTGAIPVFVDVDELGQIDIARCAELFGSDPSIRFLLPVHLFGFASSLRALSALAQSSGVRLLEDCAQAIGASDAGIKVGHVGAACATSFYPTKNLGALGDGGALLTNDVALAARARVLRNYGQSTQYVHEELGLNSRLDELHAAVLRRAFLPRLTSWTSRRREIASRYLDGIRSRSVKALAPPSDSQPVWHLFPVLVAPDRRDSFREHLKARGVLSGVHYPRLIPDQEALRGGVSFQIVGELTNARRFAASEVSLPIHPYMTDSEVDQVIEACNRWTS